MNSRTDNEKMVNSHEGEWERAILIGLFFV